MEISKYKKTFRRRILEKKLKRLVRLGIFEGLILDIGGSCKRDKVCNKKSCPKGIFIIGDINPIEDNEIKLDVQNMSEINDNVFSVIRATELFEHVEYPEKGLKECYRVLNNGGRLVMSVPFIYPEHNAPVDYCRFTKSKIEKMLCDAGFFYYSVKPMGHFFTVLADMLFILFRSKWYTKFLIPLLDILPFLDRYIKLRILKNYTTGYFVVARKWI